MEEILSHRVFEHDEDNESEVISSKEVKEGFTNLMRCLSGKRFPRNYDVKNTEKMEKKKRQVRNGRWIEMVKMVKVLMWMTRRMLWRWM